MKNLNLLQRCKKNKGFDEDTFVGLQMRNGEIKIIFPFCYELGQDDDTIRKDVLLLLDILHKHSEQENSDNPEIHSKTDLKSPIAAYMYVLKDYLLRGYYKETETVYNFSKRGKINWHRTIKTCKPYVQDNDAFYLDFITKKSTVNDNEMITLIHEFCVYKAFEVIGWLYTSFLPNKPRLKFKKDLFTSVIVQKLSSTFNDKNKLLFQNMLAIVNDAALEGLESKNYTYGVNRFEYCWESMIDRVFGISNKAAYFPTSHWEFTNNNIADTDNSKLEPDSIMLCNDKIYVLDAKYYKFGYTGYPGHLPQTSDINKQVTYGEYIHNKKRKHDKQEVFNAFLIPFNKNQNNFNTLENIHHFGQAVTDWKLGGSVEKYEKVQGIVIDLKHLMQIASSRSESEIQKLAEAIEQGFEKLNS